MMFEEASWRNRIFLTDFVGLRVKLKEKIHNASSSSSKYNTKDKIHIQ